MMKWTKTTSFNITLITLFLLLVSCTRDKSLKDSTINFPLSGQISTLDPANSYDSVSASVVYQGYEQLFEYHYLQRPYRLIPLLAKSMPKVENDGKKYIIQIKEGIQYHDDISFKGKKRFVKAQDFITQIKRLAFKFTNSNGWWLFDGRIKGINKFRETVGNDFEKFKNTEIEGISSPNDHTLIIELSEPYPQMLNALAMSFTSPLPLESVEYYKHNLNSVLIGTGAYKLDQWTRGSKVILSRYENYHKAFFPGNGDRISHARKLLKDAGKRMPFIDKVIFHINKEAQTRWLQFLSGNLDFLRVPKDNFSTVINESGKLKKEFKDKNIHVEVFSTLTFWWIGFNMNDSILGKNLNLRKAISHAIDVRKYIQTFTNNVGLKANSIYPPGIPGYDPTVSVPFEYNIEKAKEYLAKAGYPEGKGLPTLTYDTRGSSTTQRQRAEFFKNQLLKIGVNLTTQLNTFPSYLKKAREGKLQLWLDGWSLDYPDAENVLQLLTTKNVAPGPNASSYSNPEFDKMFEEVKTMANSDEKFLLMKRMENIVQRDMPWALLLYERDYYAISNRLKNFRYSDLMSNKVKYLRLGK